MSAVIIDKRPTHDEMGKWIYPYLLTYFHKEYLNENRLLAVIAMWAKSYRRNSILTRLGKTADEIRAELATGDDSGYSSYKDELAKEIRDHSIGELAKHISLSSRLQNSVDFLKKWYNGCDCFMSIDDGLNFIDTLTWKKKIDSTGQKVMTAYVKRKDGHYFITHKAPTFKYDVDEVTIRRMTDLDDRKKTLRHDIIHISYYPHGVRMKEDYSSAITLTIKIKHKPESDVLRNQLRITDLFPDIYV